MYDYYEEPEYYNPEDFLEEHEVTLREIMVNAVNKKIKNTIDDLTKEKTDNESLRKEISSLRSKLHNLEYSQKQQNEQTFKEGYKEAERKLGLGFSVNDKVWYMTSKRNESICPKCNGNYKIKVDILGKEQEVNCPHCSYGKITKYTYLPKSDIVRSINYSISRVNYNSRLSPAELKEEWVKVWLDSSDYEKKLADVYLSEEDCKKACDEENLKGNK
jgi:uncharacterized Zn-finger protein